MRKTRTIFLILILMLALSACTLSANDPVEYTPEVQDDPYKDIFDQSETQVVEDPTDDPAGDETEEPVDPTEEPVDTEEPTAVIVEPTEVEDPTEEPVDPTEAPVELPVGDLVVPEKYSIHKGESPFCLARRFDLNVVQLLNYNGLSMDYVASVGVLINIPPNASPFDGLRALLPHPDTYTVKTGENLYLIACLYGDVWPEEIAAANGLTMDDAFGLSVGQELQIP